MNLREFSIMANNEEWAALASFAGTTPAYLTKIAYSEFCGPEMAVKIEDATAALAEKNKRLQPVDMSSYVRQAKQWQYKIFRQHGTAA